MPEVARQLILLRLVPSNKIRVLLPILFLVPVIGVLSSKAMVPILLVGLLFLAGAHIKCGSFRLRFPVIFTVGLVVLLSWSVVGLTVSPLAKQGFQLVGLLAGLLLAGMIFLGLAGKFDETERRKLEFWSILGFFSAIFLMAFEAATTNFLSRILRGLDWPDIIGSGGSGENLNSFLNNGIVILTLIMWPVLTVFVSQKKRVLALLSIILMVGLSIFMNHIASLAAITAGILIWGAAYLSRKVTARLIATLFVIATISAPILVQQFTASTNLDDLTNSTVGRKLPPSAIHRLFIWKFAAQSSLQRPIFGWGLDASRSLPGGGKKFVVYDRSVGEGKTKLIYKDLLLPLHPHNQLIQIWLELGAVGAVIVALFGGIYIWKLARIERDQTPVFGLVISYLCYANLSFGAWQNWWIATIFLVAFIWQLLISNQASPKPI
ncbi:MAG: O-antigen ligase family protein [Pseudomonadota bacterium]|nr:O-antigen ligase family protein [Pseudomonadota bacterium]